MCSMPDTQSQSELSRFNLDLDAGEAVLTQATARKVLHMMLLLNAHERSSKLAQQLNITHRTLNNYRNGDRSPRLSKAIEMFDILGYDLVVRKR